MTEPTHTAAGTAVKVCLFVVDEDDDLGDVLAGVVDVLRGGPEAEAEVRSVTLEGNRGAPVSITDHAAGDVADDGDPPPSLDDLTCRELDVLDLVARGLDNGAIAEMLGISSRTVRNHLNSVFSKLNVTYRPQAVVLAREAGLGRGAPSSVRAAPGPEAAR